MLIGNPKRKRTPEIHVKRWEDNIKINVNEL
jgi:hypothetical protein